MRSFEQYHPAVLAAYFFSVILVAMFCDHPVLLTEALAGAGLFCAVLERGRNVGSNLAFYIPLFLMTALLNPLFSHNGVTPLFFLNGNPVTLEAILYGAAIAGMLIAVLLWCKCYTYIMTGDKFLYLFGRAVPKLGLVLSMALRFVPRLRMQIKQVSKAQKAMGLYASKSYLDKLRSGLRVFSAVVTWSMENAIDTGDSMRARGYGLKGRGHFSLFHFTQRDGGLLGCTVLLLGAVLTGILLKGGVFYYYPKITEITAGPLSLLLYGAFGLLSLLPFLIEVKEYIKWKYFVSKI